MWLYLVVLIFTLLYFLHRSIHNSEVGKLINKIPGPKILPVIGNCWDLLLSPVEAFNIGKTFAGRYKNIYRVWVGHIPVVNIYNPHDVEVLLSSPKYITKELPYILFQPWIGEGLLTSQGLKWKTRRRMLTPTFHFNILRSFTKIFQEESENFVNNLKNEDGKNETDVFSYISHFSLRVVCDTAMGIKLDVLPEGKKYVQSIHEIGEAITHRVLRPWLYSPFIFSMTMYGMLQKRLIKVLHKFTETVIDERSLKRINPGDAFSSDDFKYEDGDGVKKKLAMLDLLLSAESQGQIDRSGIREEVDTFMFEGHDTISMALTYGIMELANNKVVQNRARTEVVDLLTENVGDLTLETLNRMSYLERCIKEILRLYPSAPLLGRLTHEDMHLKDYLIPPNTTCLVHVFHLHRRPDLYPEPLKFDPDRFLPENCVNRHPFAYIPFSAGPRNCIGQRYAMYEMKSILSTLLIHYNLEPVTDRKDVVFKQDLVLRFAEPVKVKFTRRVL